MTFRPDDKYAETYRYPAVACPYCSHRHDASTFLPRQGEVRVPSNGDFSMCVECTRPAVFEIGSFGVALRLPTPEESAEFYRDHATAVAGLMMLKAEELDLDLGPDC